MSVTMLAVAACLYYVIGCALIVCGTASLWRVVRMQIQLGWRVTRATYLLPAGQLGIGTLIATSGQLRHSSMPETVVLLALPWIGVAAIYRGSRAIREADELPHAISAQRRTSRRP